MTALPTSTSGRDALEVATEASREAGEILKTHFREDRQVRYKGRANIVTDVDLKAEKSLRDFVQREYPHHNIVSEESEPVENDSEYTWIFDPLDGTNNYSFGIPHFATVTALTKGQDVLLGIVYDPLRDEMFAAVQGGGTTVNGKAASVTDKKVVTESLIGLDLGYIDEIGNELLRFMSVLWPNLYAFRIMGSAALGMAYAACGRLDIYFHALVYPWEIGAGKLLVTEAGGVLTDWEGNIPAVGESSIIASNQSVHADFLRLLRERTPR